MTTCLSHVNCSLLITFNACPILFITSSKNFIVAFVNTHLSKISTGIVNCTSTSTNRCSSFQLLQISFQVDRSFCSRTISLRNSTNFSFFHSNSLTTTVQNPLNKSGHVLRQFTTKFALSSSFSTCFKKAKNQFAHDHIRIRPKTKVKKTNSILRRFRRVDRSPLNFDR